MRTLREQLFTSLRQPALWFIAAYQKILSPDHSFWAKAFFPHGYCKFEPSCSAYGYAVIKKFGLRRGLAKLVWRVLRCNPWSRGGVDMPR